MIEQIENLEMMFDKQPNQKILDGLLCMQLCLTAVTIGDKELLDQLDNGR